MKEHQQLQIRIQRVFCVVRKDHGLSWMVLEVNAGSVERHSSQIRKLVGVLPQVWCLSQHSTNNIMSNLLSRRVQIDVQMIAYSSFEIINSFEWFEDLL